MAPKLDVVGDYRRFMPDKFAGGDPEYLRSTQYGTADKLEARASLHRRYRTSVVPWFEWMVTEVPWQPGLVVEAGCGTGALWEEGRPPVDGPIVLTDLSDAMVATATARAAAAGYEVEGRVAGAQDLPTSDGSAAHVIANHMLYHVPDPGLAVAEFARLLRDDGVCTVATNGERHLLSLRRIADAVFGAQGIHPTVAAFGLDSGRPLLDAHFSEVELRRFDDDLHVTSPADVLAYVASYPPGEDATPAQWAAIETEVLAAFAAGGGTMVIEKDVGLFVCRGPRRGS